LDTDSRRLELLELEGLGFSQAEVVKELSVKCACSERTVYSDFETRVSWQPVVQSVADTRKGYLPLECDLYFLRWRTGGSPFSFFLFLFWENVNKTFNFRGGDLVWIRLLEG
jgi:hypothetical protein